MGLGGMFESGDHSSVLGKLGGKIQKFTDPIAMIPGVGDKWVDLTSNKIPTATNRVLSKVMTPFDRIDETINPVRKIPIVDQIGDAVRDKPGDAIGLAIGSYFAAPAIAGAMGGAGGGAAGGASAGGLGGGAAGGGLGGLTVSPSFVSGGTAMGNLGGAGGSLGSFMGGGSGAVAGGGLNSLSVSPYYQSGGSYTGNLSGMSPQGSNWLDMAQQFMGQQSNQQQQQSQQSRKNTGIEEVVARNQAKRQAQAMALLQFNNAEAQAAQQRDGYNQRLAAQLRGY